MMGLPQERREPERMTKMKSEVFDVDINSRVCKPRIVETTQARLIRMIRVVFVLSGSLSLSLLVKMIRTPETMIVTVVR